MALAVKELIDAGVHFGHRASRWNPKMKPYIFGKRNLIHIIDLKETVRGVLRATKFFQRVASGGGLILFVGTKRQAVETILEHCKRCEMPSVTERWLGGTLTNFRTIRSRLERLEELEAILDSEQALSYSNKMVSTLSRERRKIQRNLEGIRHMTRLPEALLVVDPEREKIAVSEARKLGIKVVALMDTDCDPDMIDLPIPGNDDSMRSIDLVLKQLTEAIIEGKAAMSLEPPPEAESTGGGERGERGGRRGGGDRDRGRGDRRGGGGGGDRDRGGLQNRNAARTAAAPAPAPASASAPAAETAEEPQPQPQPQPAVAEPAPAPEAEPVAETPAS